jgi:hypothetical protein
LDSQQLAFDPCFKLILPCEIRNIDMPASGVRLAPTPTIHALPIGIPLSHERFAFRCERISTFSAGGAGHLSLSCVGKTTLDLI